MALALLKVLTSHLTTGLQRGETRGSDPSPHVKTPHMPGPTIDMPMPYTWAGLRHPSHLDVSPATPENHWVRPSSCRFGGTGCQWLNLAQINPQVLENFSVA